MRWIDLYHSRQISADDAVKCIKSGDNVYIHPGCCTPEYLVDAMVKRKDELENVTVMHILTEGKAAYTQPGMEPHFRHRSLFTGKKRPTGGERRACRSIAYVFRRGGKALDNRHR